MQRIKFHPLLTLVCGVLLLVSLDISGLSTIDLSSRIRATENDPAKVGNQSQKLLRRKIIWSLEAPQWQPEAEILDVSINGVPVASNAPVSMPPEFLGGLAVRVRNVSRKRITHIKVGLQLFNDATSLKPNTIFDLGYGADTGLPGQSASVLVQPKEIVSIRVKKNQLRRLEEIVQRLTPDLAKIKASVDYIFFDDDTAWRLGYMHRRDPNDPMRWVAVHNSNEQSPSKLIIPVRHNKSSQPLCATVTGFYYEWCALFSECYALSDSWYESEYGTKYICTLNAQCSSNGDPIAKEQCAQQYIYIYRACGPCP